MFPRSRAEASEVVLAGGRAVPRAFGVIKDKDGDGNFSPDFAGSGRKVRDGKGQQRDIPAIAQDRFGMQQAVRLWVLSRLKEKDPAAEQLDLAIVAALERALARHVWEPTRRESSLMATAGRAFDHDDPAASDLMAELADRGLVAPRISSAETVNHEPSQLAQLLARGTAP